MSLNLEKNSKGKEIHDDSRGLPLKGARLLWAL